MRLVNPRRAAERRLLDDARATRAMSWVMAVMLYLTVLASALGLATAGAARQLDRQLAGRLTVQLLDVNEAAVERLAAALRAMPEVRAATPVPRAQLAELLKPWLGEAGLDAELPMPAMIDVDLASADDETVAALTRRAEAAAPGARVDAHAQWLAPVRRFIVSLTWLAVGVVGLMAAATAAIVLLAARSGLDMHRATIDVLHMLGSTDSQIARLFQRRIALDTLVGGIIGTVPGLATVALIGHRIAALESEVASGATIGVEEWAAMAALPLAFALLAAIAARIAVTGALRKVL